jgi:hypothetical protein
MYVLFQLKFLKHKGLRGAAIWSLNTDDFKGLCYNKKYPLISFIKKNLNSLSDDFDILNLRVRNIEI